MIGRRPGPRHRVVLRTTPGRSHVGKGQRRTGIARIAGCRRAEARHGRTLNRLIAACSADGRRCGVLYCDGLALAGGVAAGVGSVIGAADAIAVGATARGDLIGIVGDCHCTAAVVSRSDRAVIGGRHFAGARHRGVGWEVVDHRRCLIINCDGLALAAAVAAGIGSMIGPGDGIAIGATTRGDLIGIVRDSHRTAAVVSRTHRAVIGRGHCARARYRGIGREVVDRRRGGVIDRDGLGASSSVAVGVGGSVGAGDDVVAT